MNKNFYKNLFSKSNKDFYIFYNQPNINKKIKEYKKEGFIIKKYFLIKKIEDKIGVAIPIDNKKVTHTALSELKTFKGRTLNKKFLINILILLNVLFGNLLFKEKFFIAFKPGKLSVFDWLSSRFGIKAKD